MRTTVDLPDDLFRMAKARSAERGESLKQMFTRLLAREVGASSAPTSGRRVALPLVGDPASASPHGPMSNADVEELLLQDEAEHHLDEMGPSLDESS